MAIAAGFPAARRRSELSSHDLLLRLPKHTHPGVDLEQRRAEALDSLEAFKVLLGLGRSPEVAALVNEPLRQATVLLWAAFEYAANEILRIILNKRPELLLGDSEVALALRKALQLGPKSLQAAPAELLGSWVAREKRLMSFAPLKRALEAAFPSQPGLLTALTEEDLALCAERRHVIAHRAGLVDQKYIERTGEPLTPGELLVVTSRIFSRQVASVAIASGELVVAAFALLSAEEL